MEDEKVSENSTFSFPITTLPQLTFVPTKLTTKEFKRVEYLVNGSNSSIFTAYHGNEKVAVKMLKENPANLKIAEQELVFEAGILARLKHQNIISISGVGEKIRKFIVLEYLEGGTLAQLLKGQKPGSTKAKQSSAPIRNLPVSMIINIAYSLASALNYLHVNVSPDATIIHRGKYFKLLLMKASLNKRF
jgi:serine/threonine protein kinase